ETEIHDYLAGEEAGIKNVEFLQGSIESLPLPDATVDVVISNCLINLSTDKRKALSEAFRVLCSGSRFAVSDIVLRRELPSEARSVMQLRTGCIAGALLECEYLEELQRAGFADVELDIVRTFECEDVESFAKSTGTETSREMTESLRGAVASAIIRARKP
ncbi:MAG TPA: methyltransferase domain-containing protein, partial [Pirellulaceae bacterium]|nr:methyltransferase domain-containing protein [Pirellulaceae bacterium]